MSSNDSGENKYQYQMPNLEVPDPPSDLPYSQVETYLNEQILLVNGFSLKKEALIELLKTERAVLQAAAAHVAGARLVKEAVPHLEAVLEGVDDYVGVEAAYALARMGVDSGREALKDFLELPIDAYLAPPIAAGYLAQLGSPAGIPVIIEALSADSTSRKSAVKQLYFLVPFDGQELDDGGRLDVFSLFDTALHDEKLHIQWQALVQLRALKDKASREILESFIARTTDESNRRLAVEILDDLEAD